MHNVFAHCAVTDAQPVPPSSEQWPPAIFPPSLCAEHVTTWFGMSLWPVVVTCPGCNPS